MPDLNIRALAEESKQEMEEIIKSPTKKTKNNSSTTQKTAKSNKPKNNIPKKEEPQKIKRGQGRPVIDESKGKKSDYCKILNIQVPEETIKNIQEYALPARGLNMTEYINILIEKDMKKNTEKYKDKISGKDIFD